MLSTITLPERADELKELVLELDAKYRARIEFLEERIRFFQKELFGRKTEKRPPEPDSRQLPLSTNLKCSVTRKLKQSV